MILTTPVARVERQVEQYFEKLHHNLFHQNAPLFLAANGRSRAEEDLELD
jgi:hypothetical protein